jgi:hypothetical protein
VSTPSQTSSFFNHSNGAIAGAGTAVPSYCYNGQQPVYCQHEPTTPQTPSSSSLSFYSYDNYQQQPQQQMNDSGVFFGNSICSKFDFKVNFKDINDRKIIYCILRFLKYSYVE